MLDLNTTTCRRSKCKPKPSIYIYIYIYMELPYGFDIDGSRRFILKLNKNLYNLKNASHNFQNLLKDDLGARRYKRQSNADSSVFLGKESIILLYIDHYIIINRCGFNVADNLIKSLKEGHENFDFADDGDLENILEQM